MDVVDIYGHIPNKSNIILAVGNYNNIHGLLTYFPTEDLLQMRSLPEIITSSVIELILAYEKPLSTNKTDRVYFTLSTKDTSLSNKFINIKIEIDGDHKVAFACLSSEKCFFWIDYSSIDVTPRSQLLSGVLYSLQTSFGEQDYTVSWKIKGFSNNNKSIIEHLNSPNGDLVIFLPTTWYELIPDSQILCQSITGTSILIDRLNQLNFKGYTTQQWCEEVPHVIHCTDDKQCGECLGYCGDSNHICYMNLDATGDKFVCGLTNKEPKLNKSTMVSFSESPLPTTGTGATWLAIIAIVVIVAILTWGLSRKSS